MDPMSIAQALADEISESVDRHIHPRTGRLMPPRLHGRRSVPNLKIGEQIIDRLDELLEVAGANWQLGGEPEVHLELCQADLGRPSEWAIEWAVEIADGSPGEESGS